MKYFIVQCEVQSERLKRKKKKNPITEYSKMKYHINSWFEFKRIFALFILYLFLIISNRWNNNVLSIKSSPPLPFFNQMLGEYISDLVYRYPGAEGTIRMNNSNICCLPRDSYSNSCVRVKFLTEKSSRWKCWSFVQREVREIF